MTYTVTIDIENAPEFSAAHNNDNRLPEETVAIWREGEKIALSLGGTLTAYLSTYEAIHLIQQLSRVSAEIQRDNNT